METKELDLGGGWKATIRRPGSFVMYQWWEVGDKHSAPKAEVYQEKGKDPGVVEAEVAANEGRPARLTWQEIQFCEETLIPAAVLSFQLPDGSTKQASQVYIPDLGMSALSKLITGIFQMVNDREAAFRDEAQAA